MTATYSDLQGASVFITGGGSGIGAALVGHVEGLCKSDRIFTSTNESNLPMQSLLQKLGYKRSGTVDDLDPGDPELFYSKPMTGADNKALHGD